MTDWLNSHLSAATKWDASPFTEFSGTYGVQMCAGQSSPSCLRAGDVIARGLQPDINSVYLEEHLTIVLVSVAQPLNTLQTDADLIVAVVVLKLTIE
jgi:hypothetical protein